MTPPLPHLKATLADTAQQLHRNGWVANHDGNVSVRVSGNRFLITPTATSKAQVRSEHILLVDASGEVLEGRLKPFGELDLHLAIYRARADVHAVIHAHPPHASAWGLHGAPLGPVVMPEVAVSLGEHLPTLPRALPRSEEGREAAGREARRCDGFLCQGNGAFAFADTLALALLRMELLEHYARILLLARPLGGLTELPESERAALRAARTRAGLGKYPL